MRNQQQVPWTKTQEGEDSILVRLAQKYAAWLPEGVALGEATREQVTAAITAGFRAERPYQAR